MYLRMNKHYSWPKMRIDIERHVAACDTCQKFKVTDIKKYGKLSLKDNAALEPFEDVQVDLIGPWRINIMQKLERTVRAEIKAFTILDTGTSLVEIIPITNKKTVNIAHIFDEEWLCRYPRPVRVIFYNGGEFKTEFNSISSNNGKKSPSHCGIRVGASHNG